MQLRVDAVVVGELRVAAVGAADLLKADQGRGRETLVEETCAMVAHETGTHEGTGMHREGLARIVRDKTVDRLVAVRGLNVDRGTKEAVGCYPD